MALYKLSTYSYTIKNKPKVTEIFEENEWHLANTFQYGMHRKWMYFYIKKIM